MNTVNNVKDFNEYCEWITYCNQDDDFDGLMGYWYYKDSFKFISYELINDTLNTINIHYGRGKIDYFTLESNGIGKVFTEIPISHFGRLRKQYKFKLLKDDFILFLGKKRKLGYKIR